jgi:hypothetical protein
MFSKDCGTERLTDQEAVHAELAGLTIADWAFPAIEVGQIKASKSHVVSFAEKATHRARSP